MNKKIIKCLFIGLAIRLAYMPMTAKADLDVKPMPISEQISQGTVDNKLGFQVVNQDNAPEFLMRKINLYKDKEGFVSYRDLNSEYLYVAVMRGEKTTGGYGVEVKSVEEIKGRIILNIQEVDPDKNDMLTEVITYPYTIIRAKVPNFMKVTVQNLQGRNYNYYDTFRNGHSIGISHTAGVIQKIYNENNFIFIQVKSNNEQPEFFYVSDNEEWRNKFKDLKSGINVNIKYALGTPQKSGDKAAMPLNDIVISNNKTDDSNRNDMYEVLGSNLKDLINKFKYKLE